jgi:hypothetical protein
VGIWKSICFDVREEPPDGRRIGDVGRCRFASTTNEEATVAATAIDNDGPRVPNCREDPRVVIIGKNRPLHRSLGSVAGKVLSDVREDASGASNGDMSREAILYNVKARFPIVIEHIRMAHQVIRDDVLKWKEAIVRILEARLSVGLRVHLVCKLGTRNLRPWIKQLLDDFGDIYQNALRSRTLPLKAFLNFSLSSLTTA